MIYTNEIYKNQTIYIAKPELLTELCEELGQVTNVIGNLVFSSVLKTDACFALDIWFNPEIVHFESISQATTILKQAGKFWFLNPIEHIRRSHLISENLRKLPKLIFSFPLKEKFPDIGCFSLLDKNTLLYVTKRWKNAPLGHYPFIEDKINPPNRAYLKLWEALTLLDTYPHAGELAVDLGASPGGWSYVMHSLGARVISVDKAELEPRIAKLPRMQFMKQSAFALEPDTFHEPIDWLLCDVACYPERLYDLTLKWIQSKKAKRMIFTIKLQGKTDMEIIKKFQKIPGAQVIHLYQNKHEVTFFYPRCG
jgi:23S rRNA (cytidine2498-2'-O)-methyltransferase